MKNCVALAISLSFLILTQCQTGPKMMDDGSDKGVWEGKVRMVDSGRKQKIWGYVQWYSDSPEGRLRVDLSAMFGISIATFIMDADGARLWLHRENRYYVSDNPQKLFSKLVKFNLDPKVFFALLRTRPRLGASWSCKDQPERLRCKSVESQKGKNVFLQLSNRVENQRDIEIKWSAKSLHFILKRSKVQVPSQVFSQKKSLGYKKIEI